METKKNKFQILKATKFCANSKRQNFSNFPVFTSKNIAVLLQIAQATHKYLDVLKLKKTPYFLLLQFYDAARKVFDQADRAFGIKHQNILKNMVASGPAPG